MTQTIFEIPSAGIFNGSYLAQVVSVQDPLNQARVQIRLYNFDGAENQDGPIWARVAVPFAGAKRGAFFLPDVGDEVLVNFVNGDCRFPIVVGGLWNGQDTAPETLTGNRVNRWTIVGKAGTRIAIEEQTPSQATISFTTPAGVSGKLTDIGGGKIEFQAAGTTITIDTKGVTVQTPATVKINASQVDVSAAQVNVSAAMSTFSGIVKCDILQATTVIATTYTPGAVNIW